MTKVFAVLVGVLSEAILTRKLFTDENLMKISPTYRLMSELQKLEDEVEGGDF